MHIAGLQKLSLLDFPDKMCCIVFAGGCNLRCPFCHNKELVLSPPEPMPESDFFAFLQKRKGILEGVCISGGEPLLQPDLPLFISKIRELGFAVKLDTNGFFPSRLAPLLQDGLLDYVAMDIKNSAEKYAVTCGIIDSATNQTDDPANHPAKHPVADIHSVNQTDDPAKQSVADIHSVTDEAGYSLREAGYSLIKESAEMIMQSGVDYEFRTTLVRELHDLDDIEKIGQQFRGAKRFFLQTFEDSGATIKNGLSPLSPEEMQKAVAILQKYVPHAKIR